MQLLDLPDDLLEAILELLSPRDFISFTSTGRLVYHWKKESSLQRKVELYHKGLKEKRKLVGDVLYEIEHHRERHEVDDDSIYLANNPLAVFLGPHYPHYKGFTLVSEKNLLTRVELALILREAKIPQTRLIELHPATAMCSSSAFRSISSDLITQHCIQVPRKSELSEEIRLRIEFIYHYYSFLLDSLTWEQMKARQERREGITGMFKTWLQDYIDTMPELLIAPPNLLAPKKSNCCLL